MRKTLYIQDQKWLIDLSEDKQVIFFYAIPLEKSEWKNHPLWQSWDPDDDYWDDEWSVGFEGVGSNLSPFLMKRELMAAVVSLIRQSHTNFFYFTPSSKQRGKIYSNLVDAFISQLGGDWECQLIEEKWFYFTKK